MSRESPSRFLVHLALLRERGLEGPMIAQVLRLPRAEAERLGLVERQPWGRLAWRIEANRQRRQRKVRP